MRINKLIINNETIYFKNRVLVTSNKNSTGKTTFLRIILYSLGWNIPSTSQVNFSKLKTIIYFNSSKGSFYLKRNNNKAELFFENKLLSNFDLSYDQPLLISTYTGISSKQLVNSLLSLMYFDQEKGWTLLNRGKVIGNNSFNIDYFLEGIINLNQINLRQKIAQIQQEIKGYKALKLALDYQNKEKEDSESNFDNEKWNKVDKLKADKVEIDSKISILNKKITELNKISNRNENFINMISNLGIYVKIDDLGNKLKITKDNIIGYESNQELINARITQLLYDKNDLLNKKSYIEDRLEQLKEINLFNIDTELQRFTYKVRSLNIDVNNIESIIKSLNKKKNKLQKEEKSQVRKNKETDLLYGKILNFADFLGVDDHIDNINFIFTRGVSKYSGSYLRLLVFAFHMAYLDILQEKTGEYYPIIIDSPWGSEIEEEKVKLMYSLIDTYFPKNQVITASMKDISSLTHIDEKIQINNGSIKQIIL